jgi:HAD superfamily hydrolase (TIGR01662 family)
MKMNLRQYKLFVFDVDGTVAERGTTALYPQVSPVLAILKEWATIALATNQGGPALHDADWMGPKDSFPSLQEVWDIYNHVACLMGATLYMALAYKTIRGDWVYPKGLPADDPRLQHNWRKPYPGMLLQAAKDAGVEQHEVLFVGDQKTDHEAATAAGVQFCYAVDFWKFCEREVLNG